MRISEVTDKFGVPTPSAEEIAHKHGVELSVIEDQIRKGMKVEAEHTDDPKLQNEIARDHLNELPDYYDRLADMETHKD